ncbi:MAG: HEAT repeat domain-containing protein [Anaerolineales bacterium]|nr:HEAT repeat domain-containing protein [Anaerolineales bacterium]
MSALDVALADLISGDENLAEAAMYKLVTFGASALPVLKKLLSSTDADHRWWAVSTLAQIDSVDVDWLRDALEDPSVEVRQSAALGLALHPDERSVPALVAALHDPDTLLSTLAVNALIEIDEAAVPALLDVLAENESGPHTLQIKAARLGAMRALATIADSRAIPTMMNALQEDSLFMRHWAETGLTNLGQDMVYLKLE